MPDAPSPPVGLQSRPVRSATTLRIGWLLIAITLYIGVYVALSASGGYGIASSGRLRYGGGLSMSDLQVWQPRFCRWHGRTQIDGSWTFSANPPGVFFAPLILMDRSFVHPTVNLFDQRPQ